MRSVVTVARETMAELQIVSQVTSTGPSQEDTQVSCCFEPRGESLVLPVPTSHCPTPRLIL